MKSKKKSVKPKISPAKRSRQKLSALKSTTQALAPLFGLYREQREMRNRIARDRAERYAAYVRQVKNPTEPLGSVAMRSVNKKSKKLPLRILAEGDSWFDYPYRLELGEPVPIQDGIITSLEKLLGYPIANMAHWGLELEQMMGLSLRKEIISRLMGEVKFDALLFSGGGNDLVGDQFCIWFNTTPPAPPPDQLMNPDAVRSIMSLLETEYRELITIRDRYSPETVIFVNTYDFPLVDGKPARCGVGPWMKPGLDFVYHQLGVQNPTSSDECLVVKILLQKFSAMLISIAKDPKVKKFVVVPTQDTLKPNQSNWQNEIHPTSKGFVSLAQKFKSAIASVFR